MKHILVALGALALLAGVTSGTAGPFDQYVGSGTVVAKNQGDEATVDDGKVVCNKTSSLPSLGGGCVLFGPWDSILVSDQVHGKTVAFQVCIDNNGDGLCGGGIKDPAGEFDRCFDDIFYSHDDAGNFFNPLGPLPTSFRETCPGGPWPGYVVFICEGVHVAGGPAGSAGTPHQHSVTTGSITGTVGGSGFGNFCAPPQNGPAKEYRIQ